MCAAQALTPGEVAPLLAALRPVTRTAASSRRVAAYLVLCRGFSSPGAGPSRGWRTGGGTVQQLLARETASGETASGEIASGEIVSGAPRPRPPSLEAQLELRPQLRKHSQVS